MRLYIKLNGLVIYHWVEVEGEHIEPTNPDSLKEDLSLLSELGLLKKMKEVKVNEEDIIVYDIHVYYEFHAK